MFTVPSLPCPDSVAIHRLAASDTHFVIELTACRGEVPCSDCAHLTHRLHSRYCRTLADLPLQDKTVSLILHTRKFFCTNLACKTRVFTERFPDLVAPYARRTLSLHQALHFIGLALGGRAGAALARALKMHASRDTLLRSLGRFATEQGSSASREAPRVVGIDDWAFRKGQRYGTILCDLERHRVIDLLADRSSQSAARWFRDHPTIKIISRDRGGIYAQAAREGAPQALQIADRWHLLKNLGEMLQRVVERNYQHLRQAARDQGKKNAARQTDEAEQTDEAQAQDGFCRLDSGLCVPIITTASVARGPTQAQEKSRCQREKRKTRYDAVVELHQQGIGKRAIARAMGLSRMTVRRYLRVGEFPEIASRGAKGRELPKQIDAHREYLSVRWEQGIGSGTVLWNELRARGFTGSLTVVYRLIRLWRAQDPAAVKNSVAGAAPRCVSIPSPRQVSWWLLYPEKAQSQSYRREGVESTRQVKALVERFQEVSHPVSAVTSRSREFIEMMANRQANCLDRWLEEATHENVPELTQFVKSLRQDYDAVHGALAYEWSNGQVEGQVNRLKMIKRQMYGRAGFPLLRQRVLARS